MKPHPRPARGLPHPRAAAPHARPLGHAAQETLAAYRKKGLAARVGFGRRPAVLVVDFILGFTDKASPLAGDFNRELAATRRVLDAARAAGAPVLFTTVAYEPGFKDAGLFVRKVPSLRYLAEGSRWVEVDPRLGRKGGEILVNKKYASAFFGTSLASTLKVMGIDTLVVTGCTTSGCVRATVVDALQHGLRAIVPRECVGDRALSPHEANLVDIDGKYGDVVSVYEVLTRLGRKRRG